MRKKLFRISALVFVATLFLTLALFEELSYVGVKLQYFLIPTIIISLLLSVALYKKDSGYLDIG